jgi:hypothetical protein
MTQEQFWMESWRAFRELLQQRYPQLTDEDLAYEKGQEEQLYARLKEKLGLTQSDIEDLMLTQRRPEDTYDVTENAFRGMPEGDPDKGGFTGTYNDNDEERRRMPPTHAPEDEGYDSGKTHSGSDTDERR